mgnify:CR=1 FL=1
MHLFSHETTKNCVKSRLRDAEDTEEMNFRYARFCLVPAIGPSQLEGVGEIFAKMGGGRIPLLLDILPACRTEGALSASQWLRALPNSF